MIQPLDYAQNHSADFIAQLQSYLQIPSISTLPEHRNDINNAAEFIANNMKEMGLQHVQIMDGPDGCPFVYGDWLENPGAPTILIYGHYDVQPVDPLDAWSKPPFSAEISDGIIWARGASDNKGQHFAHLKAIESYLATTQKLPVNIKVLLEGEEETGSPNIESFITANKRLLQADTGIISDGAMFAPGQPELDYGLRGIAALEIKMDGPGRDLHSGSFGGTVLNPAQALSQVLAALHHENGAVAIPGFYDNVRKLSEEERNLLANTGYNLKQWQGDTGAEIPWGETQFTLLERIGARPTLEINGIWSGFQGEGVKTIIPETAGAKITMRLVPNQRPDRILRLAIDHLRKIAPVEVRTEIFNQGGSWPSLTPINSKEMKKAAAVLEEVWATTPIFNLGGGSLPVVAAFQRLLDVPFILMPFGLDDNRHSPDEHLRLDYFTKGVETAIRYYTALAA